MSDKEVQKPDEKMMLTGRKARRALFYGFGVQKPLRSRVQRRAKKRRKKSR